MMKAAVFVLRVLYIPVKFFPITEKVTFISRQSDKMNIDFRMLTSRFRLESDLKIEILVKMVGNGFRAKFMYALHVFRQMYHIATSKVVVLDGYCIAASVLCHKPETKIIQIWHALGAVKKFGYQTLDKPDGTRHEVAEIMCMHKNYDYVTCASEATALYFCEGFNVEREKIVILSLPRADYLMTKDAVCEAAIGKAYPQVLEKETILYVPTFRKNGKVELNDLIDKIDPEQYILVVKPHPLDEVEISRDRGVIIDRKFSSYNWLHAADRIITDYSALGIEAALSDKPLYFYVYDIDEYMRSPGLNIMLKDEAIGEYVFTDAGRLVEAMNLPYDFDKLKEFREKYIASQTADNTEKLANFIKGLVNEKKSKDCFNFYNKA